MIRLWLHNCHKMKMVRRCPSERREHVPLPVGAVSKLIEYSSRIIEQADRSKCFLHVTRSGSYACIVHFALS